MKNKWVQVGSLILAIALFTVPLGISIYEAPAGPEPSVSASEILGPSVARVGEMVRLTVPGEQVVWETLPINKNIQVFGDENENLVASFEQPGIYTIFAAYLQDGAVKASLIQINVGGASPSPDPTVPNQPDQPATASWAWDIKVTEWCTTSSVDKKTALALAANFDAVAAEIASGALTNAQAIIKRTAELNSSLDLKGFAPVMGEIQAQLISESDIGRMVTPQDHAIVWGLISQGLKVYAK